MKLPWPAPADSHSHERAGERCPLLGQMPQPLLEAVEESPHLFRYLHAIPIEDLGLPEYRAEISHELGELRDPNIIYPVGGGGYAHVCSNPADVLDHYVSIEPSFSIDLGGLVELERRLVRSVESFAEAKSDDELAHALTEAVEGGFSARGSRRDGNGKKKPSKRQSQTADVPEGVRSEELEAAKYLIVRDKVRMGYLEPLLQDPHIETITGCGLGFLFLQHRIFGPLRTAFAFESSELLDDFVLKLSQKVGKPVTHSNPIMDAILPGGARINVVFGGEVSKRGTNFTISKPPETPMSILDLVTLGTLDYTMVAYLSLVVGEALNIFICGEGGSGKTALLNAISTFVPPAAKIVSIEDTPELIVPHRNWIREVVREGSDGKGSADVTVFSLLKAALRQRPNAIVIGEIRGEEGNVAFQAMQTGHEVMATMHASSVEKLIQRLTGVPINVPKVYIDNLNVAIIISKVRLPDGKSGRRVVSINEIINYDPSANAFAFVELFQWNGAEDNFNFGRNSYLMEQTISFKRGIPPENKKMIYDELTRRQALFERLHTQASGFLDLYEVMSRAHKEGLLR